VINYSNLPYLKQSKKKPASERAFSFHKGGQGAQMRTSHQLGLTESFYSLFPIPYSLSFSLLHSFTTSLSFRSLHFFTVHFSPFCDSNHGQHDFPLFGALLLHSNQFDLFLFCMWKCLFHQTQCIWDSKKRSKLLDADSGCIPRICNRMKTPVRPPSPPGTFRLIWLRKSGAGRSRCLRSI
jgi:hypothetical protein